MNSFCHRPAFFFFVFTSNDISPSEDEAVFNLLPDSLVHQNCSETIEFRLKKQTLKYTSVPLQKAIQAKNI